MPDFFVYWRVAVERADAAERAAHQFQARIRAAHPAVVASIYRRVEAAAPMATLMEVYAYDAALPLDAGALERQIVDQGQLALSPWIEGQRKIEVFDRRPPP